uniref:Uncharacterized protein n=1 Tax=Branchiostoma floridae TaxID=7739 RepID=C3Y8R2_BRAFL|eukprot:XP_002606958.1 hypothetical protein BRAFLDRAFT_117588 [Branchiostoma floridae]
MASRPFHIEDPLRSWVADRNIWREEYNHEWLDSFFSGWDRTSKLGSTQTRSPGTNGFRSVAPPTCSPVFPACHTAQVHGHNDVRETNTKREDYTKSWIQHLEEEGQLPNLMNVNFMKPKMPHIADVNNNQSTKINKVRNVPVTLKPAKAVEKEAKQIESGKSARKTEMTGTVVETNKKKEDYAHDWDDAEVIATQCGLSEVNDKAREELEREWRQDLLYCYPWETEGALYRDVIHVELNQKTDKMGRPVLRRKHSFGS